jgi:hypothetical protein
LAKPEGEVEWNLQYTVSSPLKEPKGLAGSTLEVNPKTLAHLNFGIFRQLRKLGTSKERICSVLGLSPADYDYIEQLG